MQRQLREAEKIIEPIAEEIYRRFGDSVYAEGETSIQETVAKILIDKKLRLQLPKAVQADLLPQN